MSEFSGAVTDDDEQLAERYLLGDPDAFAEVDRWIRIALRKRYPGLAGDHDDLAQEAHVRLLASLRAKRYSSERSLRAYVSGLVHHIGVDRIRAVYRARLSALDLSSQPAPADARDPYRDLRTADDSALLFQAILEVPPNCREMWRLMFVERLNYEQIAARLSVPVGTVKSRMWSCRRKALSALRRLRFVRSATGPG